MVQIGRSRSKSSKKSSASQLLITFILCGLSFYSGSLSPGLQASSSCPPSSGTSSTSAVDPAQQKMDERKIEAIVQQRVQAELSKEGTTSKARSQAEPTSGETPYFPKTTSKYLNGATRISKDAFVQKFDYGPPMSAEEEKNAEVLLFYNNAKSLPESEEHKRQVQIESGDGIGLLDVDTATQNCDTMNVINTDNPGNTRQCLAIVGNYESYNIQRWMRIPENGGKLNKDVDLRPVGRGYDTKGGNTFVPPSAHSISKHWDMLKTYFENVDETLKELKSAAEKVSIDNTIIVMTCNMGQSELLVNFVCNAKAKGLDVSNVLVFPTDQETKDLAEGLGLETFYDEKNFSDMPEGEANHYGDRNFVAMMYAKVVCVQLINHLGYDLLFQDVDVVWYKNPLEYFHDKNNPHSDFDMYFQDDGAHSQRYAPLSANSGFYFVRSNQRTKYLFTSLLYHGDQIIQSHSHQAALVQLMNEHSSLFGLKVKVLSRDMDEFPGGWHYHKRNKTFMMKVVKEEISPIIFHMSWTRNKDNKVKFFQQMGQWYVNDACIAHKKADIVEVFDLTDGDSLIEPCCLAEPNIVCHYRDKPSKIPCRDVDPIDAGRPSFW